MTTDFDRHYEAIGQLMEARQLRTAHHEARILIRDFPEAAKGYYLLNLIECLTNLNGGAFNTPNTIGIMNERATDADADKATIGGDMWRDQAIGMIRFRHLDRVPAAIVQARRLHRGDPNRLICLIGVEGRLAFAERRYSTAYDLHSRADREWLALGNDIDAGMAYLNLIQWLKAAVACYGRNSRPAKDLTRRIRHESHPQLRSRAGQAYVIRAPFFGLWLEHYLETHRR